ncbi:MAG TPA: AraC family transcriptional regulator [Acidobacteriaceae bacterium]|jgi:AraC-like DNA-binding protein|nr:AraC family transcriptional regulator [Acidobacteriaceae bacterium]
MHCRLVPGPPLAAFVRCFWYWEGTPQPHARERLMPNGEASIIFNLRDEEIRVYEGDDPRRVASCGLVALAGPRTNGCVIDTATEDRVIGIQFLPGGEVANCSVALEDVWGRAAGALREQLLDADSVGEMFGIVERGLLAQLARPLELHSAIDFARAHICRAPQVATVAGVLRQVGLSQRRFIEIFRDQVGLTPKAFCRVRRFQRVLERVHRRKAVDWAQVALDGGYYDQAHFIHDFQDFAGMTPGAYLAAATEHLNHVPMG